MFAFPKTVLATVATVVVAGAGAWLMLDAPTQPLRAAHAENAAVGPEVEVAAVIARQIAERQSYSGRLEAVDRVDIRPLVSGRIVAVHFKDGAVVRKGDPLFTIDAQPYQAEYDRADAQLAAAQARASLAAGEAERASKLIEGNAIARRDFDNRQNAAREAAAEVKAAKAALEAARVNLSYTAVVAPVSGRVSRAELTLGNVVTAGANAPVLTTLVSTSPIYASFSVDEQTYLRHLRTAGVKVPVSLGLSNEAGYGREGVVSSVDNRLDTVSGTIRVRASFDNADGALVPGLYARVLVGGARPRDAVLIDDAAIGTDQARKFVLVVDGESKAQYREVRLGDLHEGFRVVESGLKAGDRVIVNGVQRARPGERISAKLVDMAGVPARRKSAA